VRVRHDVRSVVAARVSRFVRTQSIDLFGDDLRCFRADNLELDPKWLPGGIQAVNPQHPAAAGNQDPDQAPVVAEKVFMIDDLFMISR